MALRRRIATGATLPGERWAFDHRLLLPYDLPRIRGAIRRTARLGSPPAIGATVAAATLGLHRRVGARAAAGVLLSGAAGPACVLVKRRTGPTPRLRPGVDPPPPVSGYPSGHAASATAVYGYLAVVAVGHRRPGRALAAAVAVVAAASARALDGSHRLADVVGGTCVGAGWLMLTVGATMDDAGLEPATSALSRRRSPS